MIKKKKTNKKFKKKKKDITYVHIPKSVYMITQ